MFFETLPKVVCIGLGDPAALRVRCVCGLDVFPLVPSLVSTGSASDCSDLFVGFVAKSLASPVRASSAMAPRLSDTDHPDRRMIELEISRFPRKECTCMPGSTTTQDRSDACDVAPARFAFHVRNRVGVVDENCFAAQWLACADPVSASPHTSRVYCA